MYIYVQYIYDRNPGLAKALTEAATTGCAPMGISTQEHQVTLVCILYCSIIMYHDNIGVLAGWKRPVLHAGQCDTLCISAFCTYQAPSSQYQRRGVATHHHTKDTYSHHADIYNILHLYHTCIESIQM